MEEQDNEETVQFKTIEHPVTITPVNNVFSNMEATAIYAVCVVLALIEPITTGTIGLAFVNGTIALAIMCALIWFDRIATRKINTALLMGAVYKAKADVYSMLLEREGTIVRDGGLTDTPDAPEETNGNSKLH